MVSRHFPAIATISAILISSSLASARAGLASSTPIPTLHPTSAATPLPQSNPSDTALLQAKVESLEAALEIQTRAFNAAITRAESNMNLLLAIIAISSAVLALLGFGIVRFWISQSVDQHISKATSTEVRSLVERELARLRADWDPRFAALYEEYKRLGALKRQ